MGYSGDAVVFQIGKGIGRKGDDVAINVVLDPDRRAPRICGQCITWNEEKGFGFIKRDDGDDNVFIHERDMIDGESIGMGDRVDFECIEDHKTGKPQAIRVRRNNDPYDDSADSTTKPEASDSSEDTGKPKHRGVIKMFRKEKGFGFIQRDDGEQPELFFHKNNLKGHVEKGKLSRGVVVEFEIGVGRKGYDEAINVDLLTGISASDVITKKSINDLDSTRLKGKCVKWNAQKGFGFIRKDDFNVFLQNGDDNIFVHFSDILNGDALNEGDRVEFQMGTRNNSRKSCAVQVKRVDDDEDAESTEDAVAVDAIKADGKQSMKRVMKQLKGSLKHHKLHCHVEYS